MNVNLWNALMKSDFVFDRESYLVLRQSCYHLVQHHVPQLLRMAEDDVVGFLSQAAKAVGECCDAGLRFDKVAYLCQLESLSDSTPEMRKRVYLRAVHDTFEQKLVMLFVAMMGIYASHCDEDDDFWEPYGLSGRYLSVEKGVEEVLQAECVVPLCDRSLPHFDRRMAVSLSMLYSVAVTWMGTDEFGFHLHNFFHYIRQNDKQEMMAWVYDARQLH